jgi:hypothetical protein
MNKEKTIGQLMAEKSVEARRKKWGNDFNKEMARLSKLAIDKRNKVIVNKNKNGSI